MKKTLFLPTVTLILSAAFLAGFGEVRIARVINPENNPDLIDPSAAMERNLYTLDEAAPREKKLDIVPWANRSWPLDSGVLASRYMDKKFLALPGWGARRDYVRENSAASGLGGGDRAQRDAWIDQLSAAEKYDLAVGDNEETLTRAQWKAGKQFAKEGKVPRWMGICEGTSVAQVLYTEPVKSVELVSPAGDTVRFHPLDIKGLASLLWSAYRLKLAVVGTRCLSTSVAKDANGIVTDESCFDVNPASFHIALLNEVGLNSRTFFVAREPSLEVWNVPVVGYAVRYFDVRTGKAHKNLREAVLKISDLGRDKFADYRAENAFAVVGVNVLAGESRSEAVNRDDSSPTHAQKISYKYQLELDRDGNIVGGEWLTAEHPDFLWGFHDLQKLRAQETEYESGNPSFTGESVPADWLTNIRALSAKNQPYDLIVHELVRRSK